MQPAAMEGGEVGAMGNADEGRLGQTLQQQLVERRLGLRIERRGRLVEEQPVGPLQEGAGQRQTLLLARRETAIPLMALIELVDIVTKLAGGKCLGDLSIGEFAGSGGEGDGIAQAAARDGFHRNAQAQALEREE